MDSNFIIGECVDRFFFFYYLFIVYKISRNFPELRVKSSGCLFGQTKSPKLEDIPFTII